MARPRILISACFPDLSSPMKGPVKRGLFPSPLSLGSAIDIRKVSSSRQVAVMDHLRTCSELQQEFDNHLSVYTSDFVSTQPCHGTKPGNEASCRSQSGGGIPGCGAERHILGPASPKHLLYCLFRDDGIPGRLVSGAPHLI